MLRCSRRTRAAISDAIRNPAPDGQLRAPTWERAAAYHLIGQRGREFPEAVVAQWADQIIAEAKTEPDGFFAPQPAISARNALAAIVLALPEDKRNASFDQLNAQLQTSSIDGIRATTMALTSAPTLA